MLLLFTDIVLHTDSSSSGEEGRDYEASALTLFVWERTVLEIQELDLALKEH
jgi:hypothetical protein